MKKTQMRLIAKNGKELSVGSYVMVDDEKYYIYTIDGTNIGIESVDGMRSYELVEPESIGALWHEEDFVEYFFAKREKF